MLRRECYQGAKCYSRQKLQGAECSKEAKYAEKESVLGRSKCSKDQTELRGKVFQRATCVEE